METSATDQKTGIGASFVGRCEGLAGNRGARRADPHQRRNKKVRRRAVVFVSAAGRRMEERPSSAYSNFAAAHSRLAPAFTLLCRSCSAPTLPRSLRHLQGMTLMSSTRTSANGGCEDGTQSSATTLHTHYPRESAFGDRCGAGAWTKSPGELRLDSPLLAA